MRNLLLASMLALGGLAALPAESTEINPPAITPGNYTRVALQAGGGSAIRTYERVINVGSLAAGAGTAWCSRYDPNPAPNKAGSFPLAPYGNTLGLPSSEEFNAPGIVPQQALYCTADVGTVTLSGEVLP